MSLKGLQSNTLSGYTIKTTFEICEKQTFSQFEK